MRILNDARAKFLVIGGYAVIRYTEPRYTKDLDISIDDPINAKLAAGRPQDLVDAGALAKSKLRSP
jgi:hypothetical protein